jgi:hypothetical protein
MQVGLGFWGDAGYEVSPKMVSHCETSSIAEQVHSGSQHVPARGYVQWGMLLRH